jgi:hypothetical protein
MPLSFWIFSAAAIALLALLVFLLREPAQNSDPQGDGPFEGLSRRHVAYFSQIRQALAEEDQSFLSSRGSRLLARRLRRERRKVVLAYLSALRGDFASLWRLARVIATMSPKVGAAQEFARFRLGVSFFVRYEWIRLQFICGLTPLPRLGALSQIVGNLAVRLETAMNDLGERAALATELASTLNRGGLHTP